MADEALGRQPPVVNLGAAGIIRCRRCRTYMNPFMGWTDGGRRFKCNVCALLNEVRACGGRVEGEGEGGCDVVVVGVVGRLGVGGVMVTCCESNCF